LEATTGNYVIRIRNNKTDWVPVTKGNGDGKAAEIYGELNVGDTLVSKASEEVRDKAAVGKVAVQ
jgi:hypothetical protein